MIETIKLCRRCSNEGWIHYLNYIDRGGKKMIRYVDHEECERCKKQKEANDYGNY